jgi:hypothetical protein
VPVRKLQSVTAEYRPDPPAHYRKYHEAEIAACLKAHRPVVVTAGADVGVVFGLDGGTPPLLMQLSCDSERKLTRATHFPCSVFVLDSPGEPIARHQADIESLDYAVRLGRDEVDLSHLPGKSSGRGSWELWARQLADPDLCGPHFYHANVVWHLRENRKTAAAYLRTMSGHHSGPAANALQKAAKAYDSVVSQLSGADASKDRLATVDGREQLISLIHQLMLLETKGQEQMAEATAKMK